MILGPISFVNLSTTQIEVGSLKCKGPTTYFPNLYCFDLNFYTLIVTCALYPIKGKYSLFCLCCFQSLNLMYSQDDRSTPSLGYPWTETTRTFIKKFVNLMLVAIVPRTP